MHFYFQTIHFYGQATCCDDPFKQMFLSSLQLDLPPRGPLIWICHPLTNVRLVYYWKKDLWIYIFLMLSILICRIPIKVIRHEHSISKSYHDRNPDYTTITKNLLKNLICSLKSDRIRTMYLIFRNYNQIQDDNLTQHFL